MYVLTFDFSNSSNPGMLAKNDVPLPAAQWRCAGGGNLAVVRHRLRHSFNHAVAGGYINCRLLIALPRLGHVFKHSIFDITPVGENIIPAAVAHGMTMEKRQYSFFVGILHRAQDVAVAENRKEAIKRPTRMKSGRRTQKGCLSADAWRYLRIDSVISGAIPVVTPSNT